MKKCNILKENIKDVISNQRVRTSFKNAKHYKPILGLVDQDLLLNMGGLSQMTPTISK